MLAQQARVGGIQAGGRGEQGGDDRDDLPAVLEPPRRFPGSKAPVEHFTRALSKELFGRNISVNNIAPGPVDTSFFYPAEDDDFVAYHQSSARNCDLTKIEDIVPWVRHLLTDGWWVNGQTLLLIGGYTTR